MCNGKISIKDAQSALKHNWQDGYAKYVNSKGCY